MSDDARLWLTGSEMPLVNAFDAALLDLDGVVYLGPEAVEHAPESIARARAAGMATLYVTNNANRLPAAVAQQLLDLGIPTAPDEVISSAQAAAALLARDTPAGSHVLVVGGLGLREAITQAGFEVVSTAAARPVAVVQGFAPTVAWSDLAEAAYAVHAGARFVATNLDLTLPTQHGIAPGNGTLVGAVRTATGVVPESAGKPQPEIFRQAAARVGADRPLAVGDRLDTDIAGANAAGMASLLVLTGVHDVAALLLAPPSQRPTFLAADLRGMFDAHPAPQRQPDGSWACRGERARVSADSLELLEVASGWQPLGRGEAGRSRVTLDAARALCCAVWEARDAGARLQDPPPVAIVDGPDAGGSDPHPPQGA